jgi:transposase
VPQQVAELFGRDRRTVQRWVKRFETHGLEGLREGERPGPTGKAGCQVMGGVGTRLATARKSLVMPATCGDGKLLSEHLQLRYDVALGVRQCQRIFGQMGFRLRRPVRPDKGRGFQKNCGVRQDVGTLSCGAWTNAISSNMARAAGCGCPQRSGIRY